MEMTIEHGVIRRTQPVPPGHVVIDEHHPQIHPYDCYGRRHMRVIACVLWDAGLTPVSLVETSEILHPPGSGPGGMVRFGDGIGRGVYRTAVPADQESPARAALETHRRAVTAWLHAGAPMPYAIMATM